LTLAGCSFTVVSMPTDSTTRVLDAGGPLFLHERPPFDPMPPCGQGVCVEMPADVASVAEPLLVSLRLLERHDGGPAVVDIQRFDVAVSLDTGHCSPRNTAAAQRLTEHPWVAAALASQLGELRRRARRILARRDRGSYRFALDHAKPGAMIPYDRLFPYDWDLIVTHEGHHYWASDQHCPKAGCPCSEIVVALQDINTPDARDIGRLRIALQSGSPRSNASSPSAARLFEPLWAKYEPELVRRHHEVRQAVVAWPAERRPTAQPAVPGRNDPCLCGSGQKFKRCCALRPPVSA
jgi:SEC-C motif